jgi:hypothetical protein
VQPFDQTFLKPGNYRVGNTRLRLSPDDLAAYADGTNRAIADGLNIPVLTHHAAPNSPDGGPQPSKSGLDCVGWLTKVSQNRDGSLSHRLEITDPLAAEKIKNGSVRFTSPELAENFRDGRGREYGRMIRHTAITPKPRNPEQGAFEPASVCFSLDDYEADSMTDPNKLTPEPTQFADDDDKPDENVADTTPEDIDVAPEPNPDSPLDKDADMKAQALVENFEAIGVMLPSDWTFDSDGAVDSLLAALKTKAASIAEEETEDVEDKVQIEEESGGIPAQFSERELGLQNQINELKSDKAKTELDKAATGMPKAFRDKVVPTGVQFDDSGEPTKLYTALEVCEIVKETIPGVMQLSEDAITEEEHPEKGFLDDKATQKGHVSHDQARETFHEIHPELRPKAAEAAV